MKPIDKTTLKRIIWQNFDLGSFNQFCLSLKIDINEIQGKGIIEKTTALVNLMEKTGRTQELFDTLVTSKPELETEYFFDPTVFLPMEQIPPTLDPVLIDVPPDQAGKRVVVLETKDPKANQLLQQYYSFLDRLEVLGDPKTQAILYARLDEAHQILRGQYSDAEYWKQMVRAEHIIRVTGAEIYRQEKLKELRKLKENAAIAAEKKQAKDEITLTWLVPVIILFYIGLIVLASLGLQSQLLGDLPIPVLGIPLSILVWAAIGSVSAILFRYYRREKKSSIIIELRLIIGRFWIGIVAGAVFYFAIRSGLFVLSNQAVDLNNVPSGQQQLILVLVWLIAFSDFIFERIVARLSGNLIGDESDKTLTSILGGTISEISQTIEQASSHQLIEFRRLTAEFKTDLAEMLVKEAEPESLHPSATKEQTDSEKDKPVDGDQIKNPTEEKKG